MALTALFTGRFQPPSIAHACTVETILRNWSFLTIGVSTPSGSLDYDPAWEAYLEMTRGNFNGHKVVFSAEEVQLMWRAWITRSGLTARVVCELVPRPHLRAFTLQYPANRFDFVHPSPHESDSAGDRCRYDLFPKLLGREIFLVEPPWRLHNSEILRQIQSGVRTWDESIAPGALELFMEFNGPERMMATS